MRKPILIIKHGALGDFIQCTAALAAIRAYHTGEHIVLLTTKSYERLAKQMPYFDEVWVDTRPKFWQLHKLMQTRRMLNTGFRRIYDLQTSSRTGWYFRFLLKPPKPEWNGIVPRCSHRHDTPHRTRMHTLDREREQLAVAGIHYEPAPDVSWLQSDVSRFRLPARYALLVPGGSPHRPEKRWPAAQFAGLANALHEKGITPVCLGTASEAEVIRDIETRAPVMSLLGQTDFADIATLARGAEFAVGNDTGPMHVIAVSGCACAVLFSDASDPALCAPRGEKVRILQTTATPQEVLAAL